MSGDSISVKNICQNPWTTHYHSSILQPMNKQTFLNSFPESARNASVQQLANAVDALDQIQQKYTNQAWWLSAWYFIPNMFWMRNQAKQSQLSVLRQNAQNQISEQVNIISSVITGGKIEHDKLVRKVMDSILEAFSSVVATKTEEKDLVILSPTWFNWGDFVDSLAEKFHGITVEIAQDAVRSRRISFIPSTENPSNRSNASSSSALMLNAAPSATGGNGSRRNSITGIRPAFKPGLGGRF